MKKPFILLLFLIISLHARPLFNEYQTTLLQSNGKTGTISDASEFVVGSSGVIMHAFNEKISTIVARFDVIAKNGTQATLRFEPFKMLSQSAFPDAGIAPVSGDKVIVNYLYDRALIITPNQNNFNEITKQFKEITWVHPDIVAAYLTKLYRPNPDKTIFQEACYQNTASLIVFAIDDKAHFVDCHNFNTLHTIPITRGGETQLPFYSRIKTIETSWFSFSSSKIPDYKSYYQTLLSKK